MYAMDKKRILMLPRTKYILCFSLVIASLVMAFSLFHYLHPFSGEAGQGGCSAPEPFAFHYMSAGVSAGPGTEYSMPLIQPEAYEFSFCYLSTVDFENLDETDHEKAYCDVAIRNLDSEIWWAVTAKAEGGNDNSATCRAYCFYRNK